MQEIIQQESILCIIAVGALLVASVFIEGGIKYGLKLFLAAYFITEASVYISSGIFFLFSYYNIIQLSVETWRVIVNIPKIVIVYALYFYLRKHPLETIKVEIAEKIVQEIFKDEDVAV